MRNKLTLSYALCALCSAIIAVCAQIVVPMPFLGVSFTLQTLAVAFSGYYLGSKKGTASVIVYLLLGTIGVPVFTGFSAGFSVIIGKSGGFLIGFIPMAFLCGFFANKGKVATVLSGFLGIIVCHIIGTVQFRTVYGGTLLSAFMLVNAPFLIKDFISVVLAIIMAKKIKKLSRI